VPFQEGSYQFQLIGVCSASSSPDAVHTFFVDHLQTAGWIQSSTYPYGGNPTSACGDPYCWVKGTAPDQRYISLEQVPSSGPPTVYQLRLGIGP
jgi:hypothetical protein